MKAHFFTTHKKMFRGEWTLIPEVGFYQEIEPYEVAGLRGKTYQREGWTYIHLDIEELECKVREELGFDDEPMLVVFEYMLCNHQRDNWLHFERSFESNDEDCILTSAKPNIRYSPSNEPYCDRDFTVYGKIEMMFAVKGQHVIFFLY